MPTYVVRYNDGSGYLGRGVASSETFKSKAKAIARAEELTTTLRPRDPKPGLLKGSGPFVYVERTWKSGDHETVASWEGHPGRGTWSRLRGLNGLGGIGSTIGTTLLTIALAAAAGGAAAAVVFKAQESALRGRLEAQGRQIGSSTSSACASAAQAQVYDTLASHGLTRERIARIQELIARYEAARSRFTSLLS